MITLCIEEVATAQGLTLEQLSQLSGVSLQDIQSYLSIETLTDETAANLRKIAAQLNVPVLKLVKPAAKREAVKLNILEIAQRKDLTLEELSNLSGVHPAILMFYSTQPLCKEKLSEIESHNQYLTKISEGLNCTIEDLQTPAELPMTKLRFEELLQEQGLTVDELSMLTEIPEQFFDLISTQPTEPQRNICDLIPCFPGCNCVLV
jgi:hypothetical protein